jgi:ankyrin repeat protein
MSQNDIDAFVMSAYKGTLTPERVMTAVMTRGIPVNGQRSWDGYSALHIAVWKKLPELVVALLAAGADANVRNRYGSTSTFRAACSSTVDILQLLIEGGGSLNAADMNGKSPVVALVLSNEGDAAARLDTLLAHVELDLDVKFEGKTAEEWAVEAGRPKLAAAIAAEVGFLAGLLAARCGGSTGLLALLTYNARRSVDLRSCRFMVRMLCVV